MTCHKKMTEVTVPLLGITTVNTPLTITMETQAGIPLITITIIIIIGIYPEIMIIPRTIGTITAIFPMTGETKSIQITTTNNHTTMIAPITTIIMIIA